MNTIIPRSLVIAAATMAVSLAASAGGAAQGGAGTVIYAFGDVKAANPSGTTRALRRGDAVYAGDTLQTGSGRTQVRFSDGGLAALRDNTDYRIAEYNYRGRTDGSERSFFNLVKGGVRFVTGAIGHVNKKNYRISTSVATIGIRGSAGNVEHENDTTTVDGYEDDLYVEAGGKRYDIGMGDSYVCTSDGCTQEQYAGADPNYEVPDEDDDFLQGEQSDGEGVACDAGGNCGGGQFAPAGAVAKYAFAQVVESDGEIITESAEQFIFADVNGVEADGTADNQIALENGAVIGMHQLDEFFPCEAPGCSFDATGATLTDTGNDAALDVTWGAWTGPWAFSDQNGPVEGAGTFHFAYSDNVTPEVDVQAATGTMYYQWDGGGTHPTLIMDGEEIAGVIENGFMSIAFAPTFEVRSFSLHGSFETESFGTLEFSAFNAFDVPVSERFVPLEGFLSAGEGSMFMFGQSFYNFAGGLVEDCCGSRGPAGVFGSYALNGSFFGGIDGAGQAALQQIVGPASGITITGTFVMPACEDCAD